MKNTQKKFLSAVLAASSVAGVVAPAVTAFAATTTEVETFVANAKKDMNFYSWNVAYGAIVSLPVDQQGKYLEQIAPLEATVKTEKIKTILTKIDEFYKTSNVSVYDEIVYKLIPEVATQQDRDYLANELSKYGKPFYETNQPNYPKATDAIIAVDNAAKAGKLDEAKALIPAAEAAIAKVDHVANNTYLKAALDEVITRNKLAVTTLGVSSVAASSAKSITVKFNRATTDADKITFDVTRLTTATTVTTTWNADKTEATLSNTSNFAEATFTVSVKSDAKEIAKENVTFAVQKVAKVEFTSKSVAVTLGTTPTGYVTYKAFDQYNNDITTSYLANNVTFQSGVQDGLTIPSSNGLLKIAAGNNISLLSLQNISIVAFDNNAGLSTTVTLPVTTATGTLSSFTLGSVDNIKLVDQDTTSVYYLPFTAKDLSGNETKDYELVKSGLILTNEELTTSLPNNVQAKLVRDPADSKKAAIEVKVKAANAISMDMPVTITAMTFNGASSVQTTLTMAKKITSIALLAPATVVSANESPVIAFEAYDQFGNKLTKFADIMGTGDGDKVDLSNLTAEKNADGTLRLLMNSMADKGTQTISATVSSTGKMSLLSINVQKEAVPTRIAVDSSKIVLAMENGSNQKFGMDGKGVKIYDQYDREMSGTNVNKALLNGANYKVVMSNTNGSVDIGAINTNTADLTSNTYKYIYADALNGGSDTIKFDLQKYDSATSTFKSLSAASASISVIKTEDIVDYTISDLSTTTVYTSTGSAITAATDVTAAAKEYGATPKVYGKTSSGAQVLLAAKDANGVDLVTATYLTNNTDFIATTTAGAFDAVKVVAKKPQDLTKTETTTKVTLSVFHKGKVVTLATDLKASTVAPVVTEIVGDGVTNDVEEVLLADVATALNGKCVAKYDANGNVTSYTSGFFFKAKDSYGKYVSPFARFDVTDVTGAGTYTIDHTTGVLTVSGAAAGDSFVITVTTSNGLSKSIKIKVVNTLTASTDSLSLKFS